MKEIIIKGNRGKVCFNTNTNSNKFRVTAVDDKGVADSHYVFNQEAISFCNSLTYIRKGGRTKFYFDGAEIHPCEYDYPVSS